MSALRALPAFARSKRFARYWAVFRAFAVSAFAWIPVARVAPSVAPSSGTISTFSCDIAYSARPSALRAVFRSWYPPQERLIRPSSTS
jgi:hypothetical protein